MASTITIESCDEVVANLNRRMERAGSAIRYKISHRYNYYALDSLYEGTDVSQRTLVTGSKRDCYTAAWFMINGIDDLVTRRLTSA